MSLTHYMQLVLEPTARVKECQKPFKHLLAMHQKQDLGIGIISTFPINELNNAEH